MGYVFNYQDAIAYHRFLQSKRNKTALALEHRLMMNMVKPQRGKRLLDIGCGTGASLMPFLDKGMLLTGLDPSVHMLDIARRQMGHRVDLHSGYAEDLPFDDNAFHYAVLCLTLEFTNDPEKALAEACRVAKDRVFVGIMNKYAITSLCRWIEGAFRKTVYRHARFFSIHEIKTLFYSLLGEVPVSWRTVCQFPGMPENDFFCRIENSRITQRSPFGAFAGVMALPVPRFRTSPLTLTCGAGPGGPPGGRAVVCPGDLKNNKDLL